MKLLPSRRVLCTPYNRAPCHFMQNHICHVHACLAVTCHLHFWQNDRNLLRATAVTRGCSPLLRATVMFHPPVTTVARKRYRNKSQHRELTLEKKILPPLLQGFELATFQSRVRRSNHRAIPAPQHLLLLFVRLLLLSLMLFVPLMVLLFLLQRMLLLLLLLLLRVCLRSHVCVCVHIGGGGGGRGVMFDMMTNLCKLLLCVMLSVVFRGMRETGWKHG